MTAPLACRATLPVSRTRRRPPHINSFLNTSNMIGFSLFSLCSLVKGIRARRERPCRSSRPSRPSKRNDETAGSAAEPQALDQLVVARDIRTLQVIEQAATLADHDQ